VKELKAKIDYIAEKELSREEKEQFLDEIQKLYQDILENTIKISEGVEKLATSKNVLSKTIDEILSMIMETSTYIDKISEEAYEQLINFFVFACSGYQCIYCSYRANDN